MKKVIALSTLSLIAGIMLFSGCSNKEVDIRKERIENFTKTYHNLPEWVTKDGSPYTAVGSAVNKGQSFFHLRNEAVALAKMALVQKVSVKVDAMTKSYYISTGAGSEAVLEDATKSATSQISSQTLSGVIVTKTYVDDSGELFVEVTLKPEVFEEFIKNNYKSQAYVYQRLQSDKAWQELKEEVKELPQNKN